MTMEEFERQISGGVSEQRFHELLRQLPDNRRVVQQRYIDELNRYGEVVSREEFCKEARKPMIVLNGDKDESNSR
jgi:hypothetical protein